jgi:hypothetical protein
MVLFVAVYEENSQVPSGILMHFVLAARTVHDASILLACPRPCFHLSILSSPNLLMARRAPHSKACCALQVGPAR